MAISWTTSANHVINDETDGTTFTSGTFTPAANTPIYIIVGVYNTADVTVSVDDSWAGSGAWTERVALVRNTAAAPDIRGLAYSMITGSSPGSGAITVTTSGTAGGCQALAWEGTGVDTTTAEGVADTGSDNSNGSAPSVALTGTAGNGVVACLFHETQAAVATWTSPMSEDQTGTQGAPSNMFSGASSTSEDAVVDVSTTGGSDDYVMIAMEITAAASGAKPWTYYQNMMRRN